MQKFSTLSDCIALAEFAHRNQQDKAGLPYIEHPRRVMNAVQAQGCMPYVQMAAILHDVTEDTAFTCDNLVTLGVPESAVDIVCLVDRDYSERWYRNITGNFVAKSADMKAELDAFYYKSIKSNPGALQVKLADIGDNLQPWRLSYLPSEKQEYLRNKYAKALEMLS